MASKALTGSPSSSVAELAVGAIPAAAVAVDFGLQAARAAPSPKRPAVLRKARRFM
jgi:hypothetical protein